MYPTRISAALRLAKLPDRLVPAVRLQVDVARLELSLGPQHVAVLRMMATLPAPVQQPPLLNCSVEAEVGRIHHPIVRKLLVAKQLKSIARWAMKFLRCPAENWLRSIACHRVCHKAKISLCSS